MYVTIRVGEPIQLTMCLTRVSWVLGEPSQKLTRTNIYKKKKTQLNPTQTCDGLD